MTLSFTEDGAELHAAALSHHVLVLLAELAENFMGDGPGVRISGNQSLSKVLAAEGGLDKIAISKLGDQAQPVRVVLFDKTAAPIGPSVGIKTVQLSWTRSALFLASVPGRAKRDWSMWNRHSISLRA